MVQKPASIKAKKEVMRGKPTTTGVASAGCLIHQIVYWMCIVCEFVNGVLVFCFHLESLVSSSAAACHCDLFQVDHSAKSVRGGNKRRV